MEDAQHAKGDPSHPFVAELAKLIQTRSKDREAIIKARRYRNMENKLGSMSGATFDGRYFQGIPEDCIHSENAQVFVAVMPADLNRYARGTTAPSHGEITQIALDHGLAGAERKQFIARGESYVAHCEVIDNPKRLARAQWKTRVKSPGPPPRQHEIKTPLQQVLTDIIKQRWFERRTGEIHREKPDDKQAVPLRITHLAVSYGINSDIHKGLLNGTRPDITRRVNIEKEKESLEKILEALDATVEEEKAALDAYNASLPKQKKQPEHPSRARAPVKPSNGRNR